MKIIFDLHHLDSVTQMLFSLNLSSHSTVLHNATVSFHLQLNTCNNALIGQLINLVLQASNNFSELFIYILYGPCYLK